MGSEGAFFDGADGVNQAAVQPEHESEGEIMNQLTRYATVAGFALALAMGSIAQDAPHPALPAQKKPVSGTPHLALPTQQTSTSIPEDQQPSQEAVAELMEVMQIDDQVNAMMSVLPAMMEHQMQAQIKAYVSQLSGSVKLTGSQQTEIEKLTQKYVGKAVNIYPETEMVAELSLLYQHHLNNNDVESLISFFGSDAGQHYLDVQPAVMKEYLPTITVRLGERRQEINSELKKELEQVVSGTKSGSTKPAL